MPKHADFVKIHANFVKQYGEKKGDDNYYAWLNERNCDDTISMEANHSKGKCTSGQCLRPVMSILTPYPFKLSESVRTDVKPLKITGIAAVVGYDKRHEMYYDADELDKFAKMLINAPMYIQHISVFDVIGKVTNAWFDRKKDTLFYAADVYDDECIQKIKLGLVKHVSIAADYETFELVNGRLPRNMYNAELSLVALAGIPQANIRIMESLSSARPITRFHLQAKVKKNKKKSEKK